MIPAMTLPPPRARLEALLETFARQRIAVIGDLALDEFVHGRTTRISREAPVLVLRHEGTDRVPGCAGNAARNVTGLGGAAVAAGLCGDDDDGARLLALLAADGIDIGAVVRVPQGRTWRKSRFTAGDLHTVQQQVMRLDQEPHYPHEERWRSALHAALKMLQSIQS